MNLLVRQNRAPFKLSSSVEASLPLVLARDNPLPPARCDWRPLGRYGVAGSGSQAPPCFPTPSRAAGEAVPDSLSSSRRPRCAIVPPCWDVRSFAPRRAGFDQEPFSPPPCLTNPSIALNRCTRGSAVSGGIPLPSESEESAFPRSLYELRGPLLN